MSQFPKLRNVVIFCFRFGKVPHWEIRSEMLNKRMDSKYSKTCEPQKGMKSPPETEKLQRWFLRDDLFDSGSSYSIKSRCLTVQAHEETQH